MVGRPIGKLPVRRIAGQQHLQINGAQNQRGQDGERIDQDQRSARQRRKTCSNSQCP